MNDLNAEQIEAEVEGIVRELYATLSRAETDFWMTTLHVPSGRWLLGMDVVDIREASEQYIATWSPEGERPIDRQEIDGLEIRVTAMSPTVACALCTSPDRKWCFADGQVDRAATAETWVFVRTHDGWKLHSGQSAIFPLED